MIMVTKKALPRRQSRVQLVELDGTPVRPSRRPAAPAWGPGHDNWRWVASPDAPESAAATLPSIDPEPESDEEWLARLDATQAAEVARIEASYRPTTADIAAYNAWLAEAGDGPEPWAVEAAHSYDDFEALRNGRQVTGDELAQLAGHGCI
jgi:hypothetical protein